MIGCRSHVPGLLAGIYLVASCGAESSSPDPSCALDEHYEYRYFGDPVNGAGFYFSHLVPTRTFTRRLSSFIRQDECSTEISACDSPELDVGDVMAALAAPEVVKVFDETKTEGLVRLRIDGPHSEGWNLKRGQAGVIFVGAAACGNAVACRDAPRALRTLLDLLRKLELQELAKPACSELRRFSASSG
jgi:hypothetical protein